MLSINMLKKSHLIGHQASIYALSPYNSANRFLSAGGEGWVVEWNLEDPENGRLLATVEGNVFALAYLPEQHWLLAGNMYGSVHWIDIAQNKNFRSIQMHRNGVFSFLPLGDKLLSLGGDGHLSIWDIKTAKSQESFQLSLRSLRSVALHPHLPELAVGASDGNIYLLDSETLALKRVIEPAHQNSVFSLKYAPDGRHLLSGGRDAYLRIWSVEEGYVELPTQPAHLFTINDIAFHPTAPLFATASRDKTIKIWNRDNFSLLKVIDTVRYGGHLKSVNKLLWSTYHNQLISCSDDRSMIVWELTTEG